MGHELEVIEVPSLIRLFASFRWKPIPNCTGRYTCRDHALVSLKRPRDLLRDAGIDVECLNIDEVELELPDRPDRIIVMPLDDENRTGFITYVKDDGSSVRYVHTLNTPSGFRRKLQAIGVDATDGNISVPPRESEGCGSHGKISESSS